MADFRNIGFMKERNKHKLNGNTDAYKTLRNKVSELIDITKNKHIEIKLKRASRIHEQFGNLKNFGLRRSAANDKIFKLFFLHPFLASTIYDNTIKTNLI